MAEDTPDTPSGRWMSLSEAAAVLDRSEKTIVRRLASGRLKGRKDSRGRWAVLLADPDTEPGQIGEAPGHAVDAGRFLSSATRQMARCVQDSSRLLHQDARRARRSAALAWGCFAVLAVAVALAGGIITTQQSAQRQQAQQQQAAAATAQANIADLELQLTESQRKLAESYRQAAAAVADAKMAQVLR